MDSESKCTSLAPSQLVSALSVATDVCDNGDLGSSTE